MTYPFAAPFRCFQYRFIRSDWALRCAAERTGRFVTGDAPMALLGGLPRRLIGPSNASMALFNLFRSSINMVRICAMSGIEGVIVSRRAQRILNCGDSGKSCRKRTF